MKFDEITRINVNEFTEKKNGLTYLSWANAWSEFMKVYPKATYKIIKSETGLPYFGTPEHGYTVFTQVTVDELTHEMWLPVMDFRNKSMLTPTTFDINKALMRCLTKNLAMFGLGLYIYAGEDLPEEEKNEIKKVNSKLDDAKAKLNALITAKALNKTAIAKQYGITAKTTLKEYQEIIEACEAI